MICNRGLTTREFGWRQYVSLYGRKGERAAMSCGAGRARDPNKTAGGARDPSLKRRGSLLVLPALASPSFPGTTAAAPSRQRADGRRRSRRERISFSKRDASASALLYTMPSASCSHLHAMLHVWPAEHAAHHGRSEALLALHSCLSCFMCLDCTQQTVLHHSLDNMQKSALERYL